MDLLLQMVDPFGDCVVMGVGRADAAIDKTLVIPQTTQAHVSFGDIQSTEERRLGVKFNYDASWFFPYNYWFYIGRIPKDEMIQISTSKEANMLSMVHQ